MTHLLRSAIATGRPASSSLRVFPAFVRGLATSTADDRLLRPVSFATSKEPYWQRIPKWENLPTEDFLRYQWQVENYVQNVKQLINFLRTVLPPNIPPATSSGSARAARGNEPVLGPEEFIGDVVAGMQRAPMSIRLSPHILSLINWQNPFSDPLLKQFIPMGSRIREDHPQLQLDPNGETEDSPVPGLIHRYADKVVFLASSVCPVYCRFCTRSYSVGVDTESVTKSRFLPIAKRWEPMFKYIENTPEVADVLVSGGDGYQLTPPQVKAIGERLFAIPHVRRMRLASKGLAVCPSRIIDPADSWADAVIQLSEAGRPMGKTIALHTHFNHPREITWITELAAQRLFQAGVTVRNQSVLLHGVNDDAATLGSLIQHLASINIQPYYVLQGDMVQGVEDLRTPLRTILDLESILRGTTAGFLTPTYIVHLPGGGGKRLVCTFEKYDRLTGHSVFRAKNSHRRGEDFVGEYWDPLWSLSAEGRAQVLAEARSSAQPKPALDPGRSRNNLVLGLT